LGSSSPRHLLIIPVIVNNETIAIIELASFKEFKKSWVKLFEELAQKIGESISIIKNLDYYQDLICKTIPNLADNNPLKIILQKLRILMIGAFSKLSRLICCLDKKGIEDWNKISGSLLEIVSTTIVSYRSNNVLENHQSALDKATSFFIFFELDLERIDDALKDLYL